MEKSTGYGMLGVPWHFLRDVAGDPTRLAFHVDPVVTVTCAGVVLESRHRGAPCQIGVHTLRAHPVHRPRISGTDKGGRFPQPRFHAGVHVDTDEVTRRVPPLLSAAVAAVHQDTRVVVGAEVVTSNIFEACLSVERAEDLFQGNRLDGVTYVPRSVVADDRYFHGL